MSRFSFRTPLRLAGLVALALGSHAAAQAAGTSGCTALYALAGGNITYVSPAGQSSLVVASGGTTVNGAALDPVSGNVYLIDRSNTGTTPAQNDLKVLNTDTGVVTTVGAITLPTGNPQVVGASFDNTPGNSRLFLLYSNYTLQEIDEATGTVVRNNIAITLPATYNNQAMTKSTATSGDMVFDGATGNLYAVLNGVVNTNDNPYIMSLGTLPGTGTAVTATNPVQMTFNGPLVRSTVNGIAINPVPNPDVVYVTTSATTATGNAGSTPAGIFTVDLATGVLTNLNGNGTGYSDLSDCAVAPAPPTVTKAFGASTIRMTTTAVPTTTTLTITISNTNPGAYFTTAPIVDTLPSGVVIAPNPGLSTTCVLSNSTTATPVAAVPSATAGGTTVTLPKDVRIPGPGSCTVTVSVTGTTRGLKTNVIPANTVSTTAGSPTTDATATLTVNGVEATIRKTQSVPGGTGATSPLNRKPGEEIEYCITATHKGALYPDATAAAIKDTLANTLEFVPNRYNGATQDVQLIRGTAAPTFFKYATTVTGQTLSLSIMPFNAANPTAQVCFYARVR
jgi:hypothetical protein